MMLGASKKKITRIASQLWSNANRIDVVDMNIARSPAMKATTRSVLPPFFTVYAHRLINGVTVAY